MAEISKTVAIIFEGVDKVGEGVTSAVGQFNKLEASVNAITQPLAAVADGVLKTDAALAALAAGGLALAIKAAGDFQGSFNEVVSISGASTAAVGKFRSDILAYAQDSTQSIEQINKSVYDAISAGVKYSDSLDLLKVSEKLSVAGRAELDSTTMLLVSTMNAYGAGMDQAQKYSDVFFQTVKVGQTTIPELSQSLANVTGIAAAAGVPIETLGAAIAALTASGIQTPQAMTGIKAALENIIKPSESCKKVAEELGIQFNAQALKSRGLEGVLKDVVTATGGNIDKMGQLFGSVEALNAVLVLGKDKSGIFAQALKDMGHAAGSTQAAFDTMAQNLGLATQNLKNNVETVLIGIGEKVLPEFGKDVSALSDVFKSVKFALDKGAFDPVFELLNTAMVRLEKAFAEIAVNLPAALELVNFDDLIKSLQELGGSIGEIFDGVDLSTPEGLAEAIQFVVDSITSLINITSGMVNAFKPVISVIVDTISASNDLDAKTQQVIGSVLGMAKVVAEAGVAIAAAVVGIYSAGVEMKGVFEIVEGSVKTAWNTIQMTIEFAALGILESLQVLVGGLNAITFGQFQGTMDSLDGAVKKIRQDFEGDWKEATDGVELVRKGFSDLKNSTDDATKGVGKTKSAVEDLPEKKETIVAVSFEEALARIREVESKMEESDIQVSVTGQADEATFKEVQRQADEYISTVRDVFVVAQSDSGQLDTTQATIDDRIKAAKNVTVTSTPDSNSLTVTQQAIDEHVIPKRDVDVVVLSDTKNLTEIKGAIEENVPEERRITVTTDFQETEFISHAENLDSHLKFKVEVDTQDIEAASIAFSDLEVTESGAAAEAERTTKAVGSIPDIKGSTVDLSCEEALTRVDRTKTVLAELPDITEARIDLAYEEAATGAGEVKATLEAIPEQKVTVADLSHDKVAIGVEQIQEVLEGIPASKVTTADLSHDGIDDGVIRVKAAIEEIPEGKESKLSLSTGEIEAGVEKANAAIETIPDTKETVVDVSFKEALDKVQEVTDELEEADIQVDITGQTDEASFKESQRKIDEYIEKIRAVTVTATADPKNLTETKKTIDDYIKTEQGVTVITIPDTKKLAETKKTIEENIPAEKRMAIAADIQKEAIKAKADEIKSYFDFKATVDVAEIQAAAKITEAAFTSVNTTLTTTSKLMDSLYGMWAKADAFDQWQIQKWISEQYDLQLKAVEIQEKLTNAQIKYLESKAAAIQSGQAMITIKGDTLAPELEAFMFKVLELVQVRVSEEHADFLMGLGV